VLDYRAAISATETAINDRAALFRRQAIAVVAAIVLALAGALVAGQWRVLAALLFLVPLSGAFFIGDFRILERWRRLLLDPWVEREIDFEAFRAAMLAHPRLPRGTLEGMLETLPSATDLTSEQTLQRPTRQAIAEACRTNHRRYADALFTRVLASAVVAAAVTTAAWSAAAPALAVGAVLLAMVIGVGAWTRYRRLAACEARIQACRTLPGFDEQAYATQRARFL
jgi:hypothetical protein